MVGDPAGARRERLGLNGAEYRILTEVGFHTLPEYFGQPAAASMDDLNDAVANGKRFCRTVDIEYEDLAEILGARFVNPGAGLVPLLEGLKVELASLQDWYEGNITDAQLDALLPAGLDPTPYGDVHTWLTDNRALIMGLITLTDVSAVPVECDFAEVELRYALPDPASNRLDEIAYLRLNRFIRLWRKLGSAGRAHRRARDELPRPRAARTSRRRTSTRRSSRCSRGSPTSRSSWPSCRCRSAWSRTGCRSGTRRSTRARAPPGSPDCCAPAPSTWRA